MTQQTTKIAGRIGIKIPNHPKANNRDYVLKSRYVMEQYLGRYLDSSEHIHHIDENPLNDELSNLQIVSKAEHARIHDSLNNHNKRILDYNKIRVLRFKGMGYKKIMKETGYPRSSIRSACYKINI